MSENVSKIIANLVVGRKQDGRARYSKQAKRELVAACIKPGVSVAHMALVNGLNANLLRKWITQYQAQVAAPITTDFPASIDAATLVPVTQLNERAPAVRRRAHLEERAATESSIEIVLGDAIVKLNGDIDSRRLRVVLDCLSTRSIREGRSS